MVLVFDYELSRLPIPPPHNFRREDRARTCTLSSVRVLLRRTGSNRRPSGYEPDELPLLYFPILGAAVGVEPTI